MNLCTEMRRYQKRQLKYGVTTGVFLFGAMWLVAAVAMENPPDDVSEWRASLWLVLGMHFIDISASTLVTPVQTVSATEVFEEAPVRELRIAPPVALAIGGYYAAQKVRLSISF